MMQYFMLGEITPETAADFYSYCSYPQSPKEICISSSGGDVGLMVGMYDLIVELDLDTVAFGLVQSAAAVLFQSGAKRFMYPNSSLMFHDMGPEGHPEKMSDSEWFLQSKLVALIMQRTGLGLIEANDLFDGTFISAQRCLQLGLCDEIRNGGTNGEVDRIPVGEGQDSGRTDDGQERGDGSGPGDVLVLKAPEA